MRGRVHGAAPVFSDRPYLIRAWERVPGAWVGEAWAGSALLLSSPAHASRAAALEAAESELRASIKTGVRIAGPIESPAAEVRVRAKGRPYGHGHDVVVAAWVPTGTSREACQARFAPQFTLIEEDR